jgi:hypothetical protein
MMFLYKGIDGLHVPYDMLPALPGMRSCTEIERLSF